VGAAACLCLSELNLPIDDNPDGTSDRKQALLFTKERRLRPQTPAFAAGLPISYHASIPGFCSTRRKVTNVDTMAADKME
jgi:hypothetical protein